MQTTIFKKLKTFLLIDRYKNGDISLGQLSKAMDISKQKDMKLLSMMGIDIIDYNLNDDLKILNKIALECDNSFLSKSYKN